MSDSSRHCRRYASIVETWTRLAQVTRMNFTSTPGANSRSGWAGSGQAQVKVVTDGHSVRLFESGCFVPAGTGHHLAFKNVYRWDYDDDTLSLWHERFGIDAPVFLFALSPQSATRLASDGAHLCGRDRYTAELELVATGFVLRWRIAGPFKDEYLEYRYRPGQEPGK